MSNSVTSGSCKKPAAKGKKNNIDIVNNLSDLNNNTNQLLCAVAGLLEAVIAHNANQCPEINVSNNNVIPLPKCPEPKKPNIIIIKKKCKENCGKKNCHHDKEQSEDGSEEEKMTKKMKVEMKKMMMKMMTMKNL